MGKWKSPNPWSDVSPGNLCQEYVENYISIVSIETPTDAVTKSTRVKRVAFNEQLAVIGGTLGLFSGISLLSMVEIVCLCLTMFKYVCHTGKNKLCKKTATKDVEKGNLDKEEAKTYVKAFVAKTIQKACQFNQKQ